MSSQQQLLQNSLQEIQELKDLCCYLHDERAKLINLVSEWKNFGKHIFGTMQNQKETYKREITDLELQERQLLNELQNFREMNAIKRNFSGNIELENIRNVGDGSSSSSPTMYSNKNEFKKNEIYMNPRDAISSPASLDNYKQSMKYVPQGTYIPAYEYASKNMNSEYASINTINAYDVKKFHQSMPRQKLSSNPNMRTSFGSDNASIVHRSNDNLTSNQQLHYTTHFNDLKYSSTDPKYHPANTPYHKNMDEHQSSNLQKNSNSKYQSMSEDERAMYRNMCKSVWQNLGKSTTYKTAV